MIDREDDGTAHQLDGIDVMRLAYLVGDLVQPAESVEQRRRLLLEGLAEWIGAEGWLWIRWEQDQAHGWHHGISQELWNRFTARSRKRPVGTGVRVGKSGAEHVLSRTGPSMPVTEVALFRDGAKPGFSPRDVSLASVILEEIEWLYRDDPAGPADPKVRLSPRQAAIATLLLQGLGRKEIADRLGISPNTLTSYIREIYRAFGVRSHAAFLNASRSGDFHGRPQAGGN